MTFLRPTAWWLLALALPILVFHLRFRKRRRIEVASLLVWRDLLGAAATRGGVRWLRDVPALVLLLLGLAGLAAALAEPVTGRAAPAPRALVAVLDASVSMNAAVSMNPSAGGATRFEAARGWLRSVLPGWGGQDEVVVWLAAREPTVLAGPTHDGGRAAALVADAAPVLAAGDLAGALRAARRASELRGLSTTLLVVTDARGAASLAAPDLRQDERVDVLVGVVGAPGALSNAEIASAELREGAVRVRIRQREGAPFARDLVLSAAGAELTRLPVILSPEGETTLDVLARAAETSELQLRLVPSDDFVHDDHLRLSRPVAPPLRVVVTASGEPSPYLLEALRAMPSLVDSTAALVARPDAPAAVLAGADVVVCEGALPERLPTTTPYLLFGAAGEPVRRPLVWRVGEHPVLRGVDLAPVRLDAASVLSPAAGERVLVETAAGPVALAVTSGRRRAVRLGFRPGATTLPLEAAFPLLVRNALEWLRGAPLLPPAVVAGEPLPLHPSAFAELRELAIAIDGAGALRVRSGEPPPLVPAPRPGGAGNLSLTTPGGAVLATSIVHWRLPEGRVLGAAQPPHARPLAEIAAALPRRDAVGDTRTEWAPLCAAAAGLLLLLGALLLGMGAPPPRRS